MDLYHSITRKQVFQARDGVASLWIQHFESNSMIVNDTSNIMITTLNMPIIDWS